MFSRDKGNDSDDGSDGGNNNGDNELPSLESVFSDSSEISLKNRGEPYSPLSFCPSLCLSLCLSVYCLIVWPSVFFHYIILIYEVLEVFWFLYIERVSKK